MEGRHVCGRFVSYDACVGVEHGGVGGVLPVFRTKVVSLCHFFFFVSKVLWTFTSVLWVNLVRVFVWGRSAWYGEGGGDGKLVCSSCRFHVFCTVVVTVVSRREDGDTSVDTVAPCTIFFRKGYDMLLPTAEESLVNAAS